MGEVKTPERNEQDLYKPEGFRNIKPEHGTLVDRAKSFVDGLFGQNTTEQKTDTKPGKKYYDDNGVLYRIGNDLQPNNTFERNEYQFKTDNMGRVTSTEGNLRLRDSDYKRSMNTMDAVGKGDQKAGDERGHTVGHQFEGSGGIENLTAMSSELNHGDYLRMENKLADALKDGAKVYLKVNPVYKGDSYRPTKYRVTYSIDGRKTTVTFRNGGNGNAK